MFRAWVIEASIFYGLISLVCLALLGELNGRISLPQPIAQLSTEFNTFLSVHDSGILHGILISLIPALLVGPTLMTLLLTYSEFKKHGADNEGWMSDARDINALLPRNRDERFWTTLLSINAGITEELYFRLLAPILFFAVTGSAFWAIFASTLWFGLAHFYQGWIGIAATTCIGALFMAVYLYVGNIWLPMLIHAMIDLNQLCFAPWFRDWLKQRRITMG
jgi:membrane protease YdiL (CAAX protease family)